MNDLARVDRSVTTKSPMQLPACLANLLAHANSERSRYDDLPIITPEQRKAIDPAIAEIDRALVGATAEQILPILATLSVVLPKKKNPEDADAMMRVYCQALSDIPADILNAAAMEAVKTLKFFPKIAELRELAAPEFYRRRAVKFRLELLAKKFDHEYRPPIADPVRPEDLQKLRKRIESRFPTRRAQPA